MKSKLEPDKVAKLLSHLTKLTSTGELEWRADDPPPSLHRGTDDLFPLFFRTELNQRPIAIYVRRYQSFNPDYETFYWLEQDEFAFLDEEDRITWQYSEQGSGLSNLMEVVRRSVAGVDEMIDDILGASVKKPN